MKPSPAENLIEAHVHLALTRSRVAYAPPQYPRWGGRTYLGGAAAQCPLVRGIAPMRSPAELAAAERREGWVPAEPWDPWPRLRSGYNDGRGGDVFFPARPALARLVSYLVALNAEKRSQNT